MAAQLSRVALIDDDEIDNYAHQRIIEKSGLVDEVLVFEYAEDALKWFRAESGKVDLILLDINMPRMNGFEFLEQYALLPDAVKATAMVMMLTTSENPIDRERAKAFSCVVKFQPKPLSDDSFRTLVNDLFGE